MASSKATRRPTAKPDLLARYGCNGFRFPDRDYYDRHLVFDHVVDGRKRPRSASGSRRSPCTLRDLLTQRWLKTAETYDRENPKQVYYLSMEFLIGRSLVNNITNLGVEEFVHEDLRSDPRQDWKEVAGAGAGRRAGQRRARPAGRVLHRLAGHARRSRPSATACATSTASSARSSRDGHQVEQPDHWLTRPDPWEVVRPNETVDGAARHVVSRSRDGADRPSIAASPIARARHPLRPARRRLRREDDQHPAALEGRDAGRLRLRRVQRRRFLRRRLRPGPRRVADPRPLPGRLDAARPVAAVPPGVLPRPLLAGRHRRPVPPPRKRLAGAAGQGRHPAQRHPSRRWPWPN